MRVVYFRSDKEMKQNLGHLNEICVLVGLKLVFTDDEKENLYKKLFGKFKSAYKST